MTIEIITCEQGSPEWYAARLGIPTASEFSTILAKGRGDADSKTRRTYMTKLAGEILTGQPMDSYSNAHMDRGKEMEPEARDLYSFVNDEPVAQVGFIRNGQKGCSPDALVGDKGLLEIKTKLPHLQVDLIVCDSFPPEHKAQSQGQLWVAEREWLDFMAYWPGLPPFEKRTYRNEDYIKTLAEAVDKFNDELAEMVERVRRYGAESEIRRQLEASAA